MIYILTDPTSADSVWCKSFLLSLTDCLRKNRMNYTEIFDCVPADAEAVFIIASDHSWTKNTIERLNSANVFPILISNNTEQLTGCIYSSVSSDIHGSIKQLLAGIGDRPTAVYGVNRNSLSDISKVDLLFSYSRGKSQKPSVFYNDGSLQNCFEDFFANGETVEAVICTNDLAAVSLVRNVKERSPARLDSLAVYSLTGGTLSEYYSPYITSLDIDYSAFGRAAIHIYKMLCKHKYMTTLSVKVSRSSSDNAPTSPVVLDCAKEEREFNRDGEIHEMMAVEKLLNNSDVTDRGIILGLMEGKTLSELSAQCFLTENALKYRIKKILATAGFADKQELVGTMRKYIATTEKL